MDKKYIEENDIDTKYLRNQLSPKELEEFEVYLMDHPALLEQVEIDVVLGDISQTSEAKCEHDRGISWSNRVPRIAYALVLVSSILAFWGLTKPDAPHNVYVSTLRSIGELPEFGKVMFNLEPRAFSWWSRQKIIIQVEEFGNTEYPYQMVIRNNDSSDTIVDEKVILTSQGNSSNGIITLELKAKDFPPGSYQLMVYQSEQGLSQDKRRLIFLTSSMPSGSLSK